MSFAALWLCYITAGMALEPLFPAKAAIVFTSDLSYKNKSHPKYSLHSRPPSRVETNWNRATCFLQMTCIPSFLLKGKAQEKIKCCMSRSWLQLPVLICPAVTKQQSRANARPFHREIKLFRRFRPHRKSKFGKLSTKHSTKKQFLCVFCSFSWTWFCKLIYTF